MIPVCARVSAERLVLCEARSDRSSRSGRSYIGRPGRGPQEGHAPQTCVRYESPFIPSARLGIQCLRGQRPRIAPLPSRRLSANREPSLQLTHCSRRFVPSLVPRRDAAQWQPQRRSMCSPPLEARLQTAQHLLSDALSAWMYNVFGIDRLRLVKVSKTASLDPTTVCPWC